MNSSVRAVAFTEMSWGSVSGFLDPPEGGVRLSWKSEEPGLEARSAGDSAWSLLGRILWPPPPLVAFSGRDSCGIHLAHSSLAGRWRN